MQSNMDTSAFTFLLEEINTLLVLEKRLEKNFALINQSPQIHLLKEHHAVIVRNLQENLRLYERFIKPGSRQL